MARGRPLSRLELERIKLLKNQGMSIAMIARKMSRSRDLVKDAIVRHKDEIELMYQAMAQESIEDYNDIILRGIAQLKAEVDDTSVRPIDRAKIIGIIFDKRQLLQNLPTVIEEQNVTTQSADESARIVAAFTEFAFSNDSEGTQGDRIEEPNAIRSALPAPSTDIQDE